jgi:hypothetical protein
LVAPQFERSIDKRIDVLALHVGFTGIGHGGLDPSPYAIRKILEGVSGLDLAVRAETQELRL